MYLSFWHVTNQSASCLLATYYFDEEYSNITSETKKTVCALSGLKSRKRSQQSESQHFFFLTIPLYLSLAYDACYKHQPLVDSTLQNHHLLVKHKCQ